MIKREMHVACTWEMRSENEILVGKPEGNRPLGRHKPNRDYNIKIGFN
jgi:hypothetical protein